MTVYQVIRRPLVTEKGVDKKENERTLVFEVAADANKTQVRQAVEKLFSVDVLDVNVIKMPAKPKRRGMHVGSRPGWKKAVVTIAAGQTIDAFGPGV